MRTPTKFLIADVTPEKIVSFIHFKRRWSWRRFRFLPEHAYMATEYCVYYLCFEDDRVWGGCPTQVNIVEEKQ